MRHRIPSERARLAGIVWCVLISQVLLYPGLEELIDALGVETSLQAGMWFLVAEFTAFVLFAGVWGAISDTTGKRRRWIMLGSSGGALAYITLIVVAPYSIPFAAILAIRVLGGAFTIGAFSLGMTMLMDLTGGSGRNMGAAGIAIGLGAALGSVIGGQLTAVNPLGPLYGGVFLLFTVVGIAATLTDRSPTTHLDIRTIVSGARTNSGLLISYSFGFIDRLTAGFFALVGVWYFRDVFGVSAQQPASHSHYSSSHSLSSNTLLERCRTGLVDSPPSLAGPSPTELESSLSGSPRCTRSQLASWFSSGCAGHSWLLQQWLW